MAAEQVVVHKGLEGIHFDTTRICHIDGQRGILLYRGYNIHDLAANATYEEVCYLLLHDRLPTKQELAEFDAALKASRTLPQPVMDVIRTFKDGHPMDVLRTAVSALGTIDPDVKDMSRSELAQRHPAHRSIPDNRCSPRTNSQRLGTSPASR